MPGFARVGDRVSSDTDTHLVGGTIVVFSVVGSFSQGSSDFFIDSLPAVRMGDGGMHATCTGPNTFYATDGSPNIFINSLPAVRSGDPTYHCSDIAGAGVGSVLPFCSSNIFGNS